MLFKILDKIRTKPKTVRNQYTFGIASVFTGILIVIWSLSLPAKFSDVNMITKKTDNNGIPFSGLLAQFKNKFNDAKKSVATVLQATSTTTATTSIKISSPGEQVLPSNKNAEPPIEIRISSSTDASSSIMTPPTIQITTSPSLQKTAQ